MNKLCECGCRGEVKSGNRFINGHNCWSKETYEKMRKANLGKKHSKESKEKMRKANLGRKDSQETCKRKRQANLGKNLGRKHSEEMCEKVRQANLGKKASKETKRKQRLAAIERIEKNIKNGGQLAPNYNPRGCGLINECGKENGYNFQHAENGGEFYIEELGYWLDGYDKEKNVVVEIDELHHFGSGGNLSEKDTKRQEEIEKFLGCEFIRIRV